MKGQGKVKGILIEGNDGHEYLLEPLEDTWRASKVAITQIGHTGGLIGPGMGNRTWLWGAYREALKALPPIPSWPTWPS